jgi:GH25 family lysozyme M1 (1,4-beta-N-acetylmuramidase)
MITLLDISDVNAPVNIEKEAASGIDGFICKVSEGHTVSDKTFQGYFHRAMNIPNKKRGGYHFYRPGNWEGQVDNYLKGGINFLAPGCLPPSIDVEEQGDRVDAIIAKNPKPYIDEINNWINEVIKRTGVQKVIIYSDRSYFKNVLAGAVFPNTLLWLADYNPKDELHPPTLHGWDKATLLQITDKYKGGDIDADIFNGTQQEFDTLTNIK